MPAVRYVAFLRAINVGGHVVKMDRLRKIFEGMRLRNVETFIASGNVIFEATGDVQALERRIEKGLAAALGYEVEVFLRSIDELAAVARYAPFDGTLDGCSLFVVFLKDTPGASARKQFAALRLDQDGLHLNKREVYWLRRGSMTDSPVAVPLGKVVGNGGTMRNVTTVRKLAAKYGAAAGR
ncbi:MAG TPA: DUF1697 domain-containing protein [Vicinamibacterales bacterium]